MRHWLACATSVTSVKKKKTEDVFYCLNTLVGYSSAPQKAILRNNDIIKCKYQIQHHFPNLPCVFTEVLKYGNKRCNLILAHSLLAKCCVLLLLHDPSSWWCEPPVEDWWSPCLRSLTMQWSSSAWLALGDQIQLVKAHRGYGTKALQWKQNSRNKFTNFCIGIVQ